jgi:hypothetical protein
MRPGSRKLLVLLLVVLQSCVVRWEVPAAVRMTQPLLCCCHRLRMSGVGGAAASTRIISCSSCPIHTLMPHSAWVAVTMMQGVVPVLLLLVWVVPMIVLLLLLELSYSCHMLLLTIPWVKPCPAGDLLLLMVHLVLVMPRLLLLVVRMVRVVMTIPCSSSCRSSGSVVRAVLLVSWVSTKRTAAVAEPPMSPSNA